MARTSYISFDEMMMSVLILTNTFLWIFIVLSHWNNSTQVDMLFHSDTLFRFRANQFLFLQLSGEAANTTFIVWFDPIIPRQQNIRFLNRKKSRVFHVHVHIMFFQDFYFCVQSINTQILTVLCRTCPFKSFVRFFHWKISYWQVLW
jgi:amino acid permease